MSSPGVLCGGGGGVGAHTPATPRSPSPGSPVLLVTRRANGSGAAAGRAAGTWLRAGARAPRTTLPSALCEPWAGSALPLVAAAPAPGGDSSPCVSAPRPCVAVGGSVGYGGRGGSAAEALALPIPPPAAASAPLPFAARPAPPARDGGPAPGPPGGRPAMKGGGGAAPSTCPPRRDRDARGPAGLLLGERGLGSGSERAPCCAGVGADGPVQGLGGPRRGSRCRRGRGRGASPESGRAWRRGRDGAAGTGRSVRCGRSRETKATVLKGGSAVGTGVWGVPVPRLEPLVPGRGRERPRDPPARVRTRFRRAVPVQSPLTFLPLPL